MRKIGIIGAMDEEVAVLKQIMKDVTVTKRASMEFYSGILNGTPAVVVRSGIGKVNAACCAQILVDLFGIDCLINTGIAGSLEAKINIGDLVISSDVLHHDMDAREFGYARGQIPRMDTLSFKADERMVEAAKKACAKANPEIAAFVGRVVSGDQFIASRAVKDEIKSWTDGYCTEMEGAAIAQAAYLNDIPFVILRAISDKADDSATVDYPTFEAQAILHSVKLVQELVTLLKEI